MAANGFDGEGDVERPKRSEVTLVEIVEERTEVVVQAQNGDKLVVIEEEILIEIEDLEECGKHGREPRRAKAYRLVIDREEKVVHCHEMTGAEILALVGKRPEKFTLTEKLHGGARVRIEPDDVVVFHRHKVERFETSPKSANNGEAPLAGALTPDDVEYLNALGLPWKLVPLPSLHPGMRGLNSPGQALVLGGYRLPDALTPSVVGLMIRIPVQYPVAPLDMFNVFPKVSRVDGRALPCVSLFLFQGEQWQQWSRHRCPDTPWNPAVDSLATHMSLVESALKNDAK